MQLLNLLLQHPFVLLVGYTWAAEDHFEALLHHQVAAPERPRNGIVVDLVEGQPRPQVVFRPQTY
jgi:hypothetical protein